MKNLLKTKAKRMLALVLVLVLVVGAIPVVGINGSETYEVGDSVPVDVATTSPGAVEVTLVEPVPLGGNFTARIESSGQAPVYFGVGSRVEVPLSQAHLIAQTVRIEAPIAVNAPAPAIVIHIENGLMLGGVVPGFTGTGHNRVFNVANLMYPLPGVVTHGTWLPAPPVVQNRTGNTAQPLSGTLVYFIAQGIDTVGIALEVLADALFSVTGNPGMLYTDIVRVETFANINMTPAQLQEQTSSSFNTHIAGLTPYQTITLEEYFISGSHAVSVRPISPTPANQSLTLGQGANWESHMYLHYDTVFPTSRVSNALSEEMTIVLHINKNLGVQGVGSPAGSGITDGVTVPIHAGFLEPMLTYTIDRTISTVFDIVTITLTQSANRRIYVYGQIPYDATPGEYSRIGFQSSQSSVTPLQGGAVLGMVQWGWQVIRVVESGGPGILTIRPLPNVPLHSPVPSDAAMTNLGGFLIDNRTGGPLQNQAIRVELDSPAQGIGVQAARIPVTTAGFSELYVVTTSGRTVHYTHPDVVFNAPFLPVGGSQHSVNISFLNALNPGEYIAEFFYEIAGAIPTTFQYGAYQNQGSWPTNFVFFGQIYDHTPGHTFSATGFVGERDDASPDGICETVRSLPATDVRTIYAGNSIARARITYNSSPGSLGTTLVAGEPLQRRHVTFHNQATGGRSSANAQVSAVKGHYVYLRAPFGVLDIARETLEVTWMGQTLTEGNGMYVTEVIDSTGSRVFRLALPDVIMGGVRENFGSVSGNGNQGYTGIDVFFDVRALHSAATQSFPMNQVAVIVPMDDRITPQGQSGIFTSASRDFDIVHDDGSMRVGQGLYASGRSQSSVTVAEQASFDTWFTARSVDTTGTTLAVSEGYDWTASTGWLNLVPGGGVVREFHFRNNTENPVGQFHAFIPVPKYDQFLPINTILEDALRPNIQRDTFEFGLNLLSEVETTATGFTILYSTEYEFDLNSTNFVTWAEIANPDDIKMILITADRNIAPLEVNHFTFHFGIETANTTLYFAGAQNAYAALTHSSVLGTAMRNISQPVAMRLWNHVQFHTNHGTSTVFRHDYIAHGGTVSAPTPPPTRTGYHLTGWATTPAGGTYFNFATSITAPVTHLYAQWRRNFYNINYQFTGDVPPSVTAPATRTAITAGTTGLAATYVSTNPITGTLGGQPGIFTFQGWMASNITNPASFTMPDANVQFTGNWVFTPEFNISYQITSTVNPPDATITNAPPASVAVLAGTTGITIAARPTTTELYNAEGIRGSWHFTGWNHATITGLTFTMPAENVMFTGAWVFHPGIPYVIYNVVGARPATYENMPTPLAQLETSGTTVTVAGVPTTTETINGSIQGTWTFNGWTTTDVTVASNGTFTMPNDNVELLGNWTFTPDVFQITYAFTGDAPAGVTAPATRGNIAAGTANLAATAVTFPVTGMRDGVAGTWTFNGWTASNVTNAANFTMPNGDVNFTGSWAFTPAITPPPPPPPPPANLVISKASNPVHGSHVREGQVITYTITVTNTGESSAHNVAIIDNIPAGMTLVPGSATLAPSVSGNTLTWNVVSITPGQTVVVSFQVTVDQLPSNVYERIFRNTAVVDGRNTNTVELTVRRLVKNPDRTVVNVGEAINWTLRGFHNPTDSAVANFTIIDMPGVGLNFQSGSIPAFYNGAGVTYEIRYRVAGSSQWHTHATGIDASAPFTFNLPQPGDLYYTDIGLFFGTVPVGFALGNEIVLTFVVGDNAPNNQLINDFLLRFDISTHEGSSPDRPTVLPQLPVPYTPEPTPPLVSDIPDSAITPEPPTEPAPDTNITVTPPSITDPGDATPGTGRINPQTSDSNSRIWLFLSLVGMLLSAGVLFVVTKKKKAV